MFVISIAVFAIILTGLKVGTVTIPLVVVLLLAFFAITMKAHQALYDARPDQSNLTIFYVTMSVGGALGGLFNSMVAPNIFSDLHEARITILLAAALFLVGGPRPNRRDITRAVLLAGLIALPILAGFITGDLIKTEQLVIAMCVVFLIALILGNRNALTAFSVSTSILVMGFFLSGGDAYFKDRSFFGTHSIKDEGDVRRYYNGTTTHGAQLISELDTETRPTPLFYYHVNGPMAQVMTSDLFEDATDVGIVGLGVGSLACFGREGQNWQFYEIDAMVDQIARDPSLFTFMSACAADAPTHLGDARVVLEQQHGLLYDILVIDAYSSDAVPVHLTTVEAIELYMSRLKPGGVLMLHISNRYYDIRKPLGRSAQELNLSCVEVQDPCR